ncbi:MAG: hypothetical protein CMI79_03865 [Candidatus Pelagibacter sp.]|nr:hypothetical protein [Candidatus Pelagibacter sp.]|tara:strand:- start:112 stop:711 length:600 start_codon:yes stop_codon:yes gene_type:complete
MASNSKRISKKSLLQLTLISLGVIIIFFTYFKKDNEQKLEIIENKKTEVEDDIKEGLNTFENIEYEGKDANDNKFIINSEYAEFTSEKTNIIYMKKMFCRFFFKDGTILKITSDEGVYNNITNDIEFENNVKMYYLENRLFSEKASFINSENYLLVQDDVVGEGPLGNLAADKVNLDLIDKKMKISMYNESKVNIKVNY